MNRNSRIAVLVFLTTATTATAQGTRILIGAPPTRTFPDAECSYTLPEKDWEWIEPRPTRHGKDVPIAVARNHRGFVFQLLVSPLTQPPRSGWYQSFEDGFLSSGKWRKVDSKYFDFKGVPSYQFIVESMTDSFAGSIRVMLANDKSYELQLLKGSGRVPTEAESEAVFDEFNFIGAPRPMLPPYKSVHEQETELEREPKFSLGGGTAVVTIGVASLLFFGACFVIWLRRGGLRGD